MRDTIEAIPTIAKVPIVVIPSIVALYLVWFVTMGVGASAAAAADAGRKNTAILETQTKVLQAMCFAVANGDTAVLRKCAGMD